MAANVQRLAEFIRPTTFGDFNVVSYNRSGSFAFALVKGDLPREGLMVRVQSACMFGESFGVNSCDCGEQLTRALRAGSAEAAFLLVYMLDQEGRGLGMFQKIKAIEAEAKHDVDMVEAFRLLGLPLDLREYRAAAEIVRDLNGSRPIRLLTNNPKKVEGLVENGIPVAERLPLLVDPNPACRRYLAAKKHKMGHILPNVD
jgi:GTP cyclohydrolase II/3,4-dihydroxy 2-butanone 4-phosphate synthase/GTP cyclohydrolase II